MTSSGPALVTFIENTLEVDIAALPEMIARRPEAVLQRKEAFYASLADSWHGTPLARLRDGVTPGDTWPVLSVHSQDVVSMAKDLYRPSALGRSAPAEVAARSLETTKALLLYADGLIVPNPFWIPLTRLDDERRGAVPTNYSFLVSLAQIAQLRTLLQAEVIEVGEPDVSALRVREILIGDERVNALAAQIGRNLYGQGLVLRNFDQWHLRGAANLLLERVLWQFAYNAEALAAAGDATLLFESEMDRAAAQALISALPSINVSDVSEPERLALHELLALQLPGVADLDLVDMVHIRDDDAFGIFRTDMSAALRDATAPLESGDLAAAQRVVADHMAAGVARLAGRTRRGRLSDALAGDAVGWLIGVAIANSLAGLRGVLAALVGKGLIELLRPTPSRSERALRAHYVALSSGPEHSRRELDFTVQDMRAFDDWSDVAATSAAIEDLLALLDDDPTQ